MIDPAKKSRCSSTAPISTPPRSARLRHRLQAAAARIPDARLSAARLLLHGAGRGSGIFLDPPADRLARLQRLHGRDQAGQGIHRLDRPPQDQGQHGHRARRRCAWKSPTSIDHMVLFSGDGDFRSLVEALQRKGAQGHGRLDHGHPAADDRRRTAPPGRPFHRPDDAARPKIGRDPSERPRAARPEPAEVERATTTDGARRPLPADAALVPRAEPRPRLPALPAPA